MAMDAAEPRPMAQLRPQQDRGRTQGRLGAALLALGLAVPILALRTEQNISNELILQPRWALCGDRGAAGVRARLLYLAGARLPAQAAHVPGPAPGSDAHFPSCC